MSDFLAQRRQRLAALNQRFYPGYVSPRESFRREVLSHLGPASIALDYGAGRGNNRIADFRGHAGRLCGVDVDAAVLENPFLDEARQLEQGNIPYPDDYFDVVYSLYVLEHLEHPREVLQEIQRVLKPQGVFVALAPCALHYVALIAKATPHTFHEYAVQKIHGRQSRDTFPTFYRANSERRLLRLAGQVGLTRRRLDFLEGVPDYLGFHTLTYLLGVGYERLVSRFHALRHFRSNVLVVLAKEAEQAGGSSRRAA